MIFILAIVLMYLSEGSLDILLLFVGAVIWICLESSAKTDPPPDRPRNVTTQYGNLDFNSYEWEKTWDGKLENKYNGVIFTPDGNGNWYSNDTDENGNSEEYGYYEVKDW